MGQRTPKLRPEVNAVKLRLTRPLQLTPEWPFHRLCACLTCPEPAEITLNLTALRPEVGNQRQCGLKRPIREHKSADSIKNRDARNSHGECPWFRARNRIVQRFPIQRNFVTWLLAIRNALNRRRKLPLPMLIAVMLSGKRKGVQTEVDILFNLIAIAHMKKGRMA